MEERGFHLCRGTSPEQAHHVLHHRCIAGQRDSATVNACEAELLLGHPEELAEDCRAKERKRHLEPHTVGGVHDEVSLAGHR